MALCNVTASVVLAPWDPSAVLGVSGSDKSQAVPGCIPCQSKGSQSSGMLPRQPPKQEREQEKHKSPARAKPERTSTSRGKGMGLVGQFLLDPISRKGAPTHFSHIPHICYVFRARDRSGNTPPRFS